MTQKMDEQKKKALERLNEETAFSTDPNVRESLSPEERARREEWKRKEYFEEEHKQKCHRCAEALTSSNGWRRDPKLGPGFVPYCIKCQQAHYQVLVSTLGYKLSMFVTAATYNVPYLPEYFEEAKKYAKNRGTWGGYVAVLKSHKIYTEDSCAGFKDGVSDIKQAFSGILDTIEVDDEMRNHDDYKNSKVEQEKFWGTGPAEHPYTQSDYDTLDKTYDALTTDRPYRNAQSELAIQKICKWTLDQERCMNAKEYSDAQKIGQLIKNEMESEQLRKKDELPDDIVRIDDMVQAIERAGLHMMDYDELCKELANKSFHATYPYTRDAADQMLLKIRNATAWNEGQPEVPRLDDKFAIEDNLQEFAEEQTEEDKAIYRDLGLYPLDMHPKQDT